MTVTKTGIDRNDSGGENSGIVITKQKLTCFLKLKFRNFR